MQPMLVPEASTHLELVAFSARCLAPAYPEHRGQHGELETLWLTTLILAREARILPEQVASLARSMRPESAVSLEKHETKESCWEPAQKVAQTQQMEVHRDPILEQDL